MQSKHYYSNQNKDKDTRNNSLKSTIFALILGVGAGTKLSRLAHQEAQEEQKWKQSDEEMQKEEKEKIAEEKERIEEEKERIAEEQEQR